MALNISWVRHAESVTNFFEGNVTDFYNFMKTTGGKRSKPNLAYVEETDISLNNFTEHITNAREREIDEYKPHINEIVEKMNEFKTSDNYKLFELYNSNTEIPEKKKRDQSFDKEQEEKKDTPPKDISAYPRMKYSKMVTDINNLQVDIWADKDLTDEKLNNYKTKWKMADGTEFKEYKPPCTWLFTPTLTYIGVQQAKMLGADYLTRNQYDLIICSPTVRTIMTALFSLFSSDILSDINKKIYIVPYINEIYNGSGYFDRANGAIPYKIITRVIEMIAEFVVNHLNVKKEKEEIIDLIDTTAYITEMTKFDNNEIERREKSEGNYEHFMEHYLHLFLEDKKLLKINNILAFSHGKLISEDILKPDEVLDKNIGLAFFPNNCSVFIAPYTKENKKYTLNYTNKTRDTEIQNSYFYTIAEKNYFTRNTVNIDKHTNISTNISNDIEEFGFPLPDYLGSFARTNGARFKEETENLKGEDYWCSLTETHLRGDINELWMKCLNKYAKCNTVMYRTLQHENFIRTATNTGGSSTRRRLSKKHRRRLSKNHRHPKRRTNKKKAGKRKTKKN